MCKRIVSLMTVMMVMITMRAAPFPFLVRELTSCVGSNTTNIKHEEDSNDKSMTLLIDIDIGAEAQKAELGVLSLIVTGFQDEAIFFGDIDVTDSYKTITAEDYPDRTLNFDCEKNFDEKYIRGMLRGKGFDEEVLTIAYYDAVPQQITNSCQIILQEKAKRAGNNERLVLI